jgi:alpha-tubulin suppressor-like RCC1 family protein
MKKNLLLLPLTALLFSACDNSIDIPEDANVTNTKGEVIANPTKQKNDEAQAARIKNAEKTQAQREQAHIEEALRVQALNEMDTANNRTDIDDISKNLPRGVAEHFITSSDITISGSLSVEDNVSQLTTGYFELAIAPEYGSINIDRDGSFYYYPDSNYVGEDEFFFSVYNNEGNNSVLTKITIDVQPRISRWKDIALNQNGLALLDTHNNLYVQSQISTLKDGRIRTSNGYKDSFNLTQIEGEHQWKSIASYDRQFLGIEDNGTMSLVYHANKNTNTSTIVHAGARDTKYPKTWKMATNEESDSYAIALDNTLWKFEAINKGTEVLDNSTDWDILSAIDDNVIALKKNGSLWTWGSNSYGELGKGDSFSDSKYALPQLVDNDAYKAIAGGYRTNAAIKSDGSLWVWGIASGYLVKELAVDARTPINVPTQFGDEKNWKSIELGRLHGMAIKENGTLWGWGKNEYGEVGTGNFVEVNVPIQIGSDNDWQKVLVASRLTLGLKKDGTIWGWGDNRGHIFLNQADQIISTPIQLGVSEAINIFEKQQIKGTFDAFSVEQYTTYHGLLTAIDSQHEQSVSPVRLVDFRSATLDNFVFELVQNAQQGTLELEETGLFKYTPDIRFGSDTFTYRVRSNPNKDDVYDVVTVKIEIRDDVSYTAVDNVSSQVLALKSDGSLRTWGDNIYFENSIKSSKSQIPQQIGGNIPYTKICSKNMSALRSDNTLWTFGKLKNHAEQKYVPLFAQIDDPLYNVAGISDVVWKDLSCGEGYSYFLSNKGALWLHNDASKHVRLTRFDAVSKWKKVVTTYSSNVGIKEDGTLWIWKDTNTPIQLGNDNDWNSIYIGTTAGFAIKNNGTLWVWGNNLYGVFGNGKNRDSSELPIQVGSDSDWRSVSTRSSSVSAIKEDGSMWAWGYNMLGAFGDGQNAGASLDFNHFEGSTMALTSWIPSKIGVDRHWKSISTGTMINMGVTINGRLYAWKINPNNRNVEFLFYPDNTDGSLTPVYIDK